MARILAVDAQPAARQSVTRLLRRAGHEVYEAPEGRPALRLAASRPFDVAIVDQELPELDGLHVLQRLREIQPGCMRILAAGQRHQGQARAAARQGAISRVLPRPFAHDELQQAVDAVLAIRERMQEVAAVQQRAAAAEEQRLLDECLREEVISLALQPIISAVDRSTFGYEALLRSRHPVLSEPLSLLRAAERHSALGLLADVVFTRADQWLGQLPPQARLFINLHPDELLDLPALERRLERLEAHATRVVLEISERTPLEQVVGRADALERIQQRGFALAVDDLGSNGGSSLGMLAALRPAFVKADMSLIRGVDTDPRRREMVRLLQRRSVLKKKYNKK